MNWRQTVDRGPTDRQQALEATQLSWLRTDPAGVLFGCLMRRERRQRLSKVSTV